jgi:protein disulfide-isomerase A6
LPASKAPDLELSPAPTLRFNPALEAAITTRILFVYFQIVYTVNMLFNRLIPAAIALLPAIASASAVVDLDSKNFDSVVLKSGKPALVEFFAPWCGHCKNLAPVYEELGTNFAHANEKVTIAKVDADNHKDLGKRFGVSGFPTLKWFDGKSDKPVDYDGGRDLESLAKWVTDKTGLKMKVKGKLPSHVAILDDKSFKEKVGKDQDVLVAFTAPWCGRKSPFPTASVGGAVLMTTIDCKNLKPIWEDLAKAFSNEPSVIIAQVDAEAENSKALATEQGVQSYPTLKWFKKGSTEPAPYDGPRTIGDFVDFINTNSGTHRTPSGGLDATGGTIEALDTVLSKAKGAWSTAADEFQKASEGLKDKYVTPSVIKPLHDHG